MLLGSKALTPCIRLGFVPARMNAGTYLLSQKNLPLEIASKNLLAKAVPADAV